MPSGFSAGRGHRVHLLLGEHDPTKELEGDDWVDANLLLLPPGLGGARHRLHFVSACGRNDWTAELSVRTSRA